ncbi:hypothetical protein C8J57DRAFT_1215810 [Mycena rebaudengoi]|nr:hypothetical protein C8J57DRAFT_1215810 [Mycena rebaudengoi]
MTPPFQFLVFIFPPPTNVANPMEPSPSTAASGESPMSAGTPTRAMAGPTAARSMPTSIHPGASSAETPSTTLSASPSTPAHSLSTPAFTSSNVLRASPTTTTLLSASPSTPAHFRRTPTSPMAILTTLPSVVALTTTSGDSGNTPPAPTSPVQRTSPNTTSPLSSSTALLPASTVPNAEAASHGLRWDNFPQSRPLTNAPTTPIKRAKPWGRPPGVKGKGKGKGKENPPMSSAATVPRKQKAAELWRQTYDDDGNVVPLDPGAPTGEVSKKRRKELLDMGKTLVEEAEAAAALKEKTRRMLANPDGLYPVVIWAPAGVESSGAGVDAHSHTGKRARKLAKDRNGDDIVLPGRRRQDAKESVAAGGGGWGRTAIKDDGGRSWGQGVRAREVGGIKRKRVDLRWRGKGRRGKKRDSAPSWIHGLNPQIRALNPHGICGEQHRNRGVPANEGGGRQAAEWKGMRRAEGEQPAQERISLEGGSR